MTTSLYVISRLLRFLLYKKKCAIRRNMKSGKAKGGREGGRNRRAFLKSVCCSPPAVNTSLFLVMDEIRQQQVIQSRGRRCLERKKAVEVVIKHLATGGVVIRFEGPGGGPRRLCRSYAYIPGYARTSTGPVEQGCTFFFFYIHD